MMPAYYVLLGPPGAGKGTQAKLIAENMHIPHISSGDIFRENIKNKTEMGMLAKGFIDRGELVPDDTTIEMIRERLSRPDCVAGALLDGFPRTPAQAEALDKMLADFQGEVTAVPYINVSDAILIERLTGRWTCRAQGHVFHQVFQPPKRAGICDYDGSELYQRDDDTLETVSNRIQVYAHQTAPLIAFYRKAGLLVEVDGSLPIDQVGKDMLAALRAFKKS
jgi:adenylate kinase